jgi:hypothetical protein
MKTASTLLSVVALALSGSAFAGGGPYPEPYLDQSSAEVSRAQVVAELREAQRLGLTTIGEGDVPEATQQQQQLIAEAGRRAAEEERIAAASKPQASAPAQSAPPTAVANRELGRKLFRL